MADTEIIAVVIVNEKLPENNEDVSVEDTVCKLLKYHIVKDYMTSKQSFSILNNKVRRPRPNTISDNSIHLVEMRQSVEKCTLGLAKNTLRLPHNRRVCNFCGRQTRFGKSVTYYNSKCNSIQFAATQSSSGI
ncbi:hypothetical protein TNCV_3417681 [Trichonephila clavipes]|nr:hypothetical protein TNCV_3417681 [Trichonephila clavipes]